jgi:hypothetical protein
MKKNTIRWTSMLLLMLFVVTSYANNKKTEVIDIINKVNTYWQSENPVPANAFWHPAAYHTGNMAAYFVTGREEYLRYSEKWAEHNQWKGAKSDDKSQWKYTYGETDNHVLFGDWQTCFQTYADLYNIKPDEHKIARARKSLNTRCQHPTTIIGGGRTGYIWSCRR